MDSLHADIIWPPYYKSFAAASARTAARDAADWIAAVEIEIVADLTEPHWMALRSFRLAHEHHDAIVGLFDEGKAASAVALMGPCFEALARGVWCREISNEQALEHFRSGKDTLRPEQLLRTCKKGATSDWIDRLLLLWEISKKDLHGYTHGGYALLLTRDAADALPSELVARALRFATQTALAAMKECSLMLGAYDQILPELMVHVRRLAVPDQDAVRELQAQRSR